VLDQQPPPVIFSDTINSNFGLDVFDLNEIMIRSFFGSAALGGEVAQWEVVLPTDPDALDPGCRFIDEGSDGVDISIAQPLPVGASLDSTSGILVIPQDNNFSWDGCIRATNESGFDIQRLSIFPFLALT